MKEQLISFKTAKLAKEKGFGWKCYATYHDYPNMYKRYSKEKLIKKNLDKVGLGYNYDTIVISSTEERNGYLGVSPPKEFIRYSKFENILRNSNDDYSEFWYSAPTQSLLQKWLREKFNIQIEISVGVKYIENILTNLYSYSVFTPSSQLKENLKFSPKKFKSYEEALEEALEKALRSIKTY